MVHQRRTRGDADTAERQHLHALGRVSSLHLLILPIPERHDISFLSNLRQRWAMKMPLHRLVPPRYTAKQRAGGRRACWTQPRGGGGTRKQEWKRRMRQREVLTGTRGRVHTTLPSHLRKSTNVAAEGRLPDWALLFPKRFLQSCRGSGRVQEPRDGESAYGPMRGARATRQRQYHNHSSGGRI